MIIDMRFLLAMLHSLDFLFILLLLGIFDPTELINGIRQGLSETSENLTNFCKPELNCLGLVALNGLLDDKLDFNESELGNHAKGLTAFGFLSVQPGGSKLSKKLHYAFLHKSFQEFFAAFFICSQIQSKEIKAEELVSDPKYFVELKQILLFSCGI